MPEAPADILAFVIIDSRLVSKVAALASLDLTPDEEEQMSQQLTRIVEHFEALRSISPELLHEDTDPRPALSRLDQPHSLGLSPVVEKNAPEFSHGHFVVPRVVVRSE